MHIHAHTEKYKYVYVCVHAYEDFFFKFWVADASHSLKSRCVGVPVLLNPDPGFVPLPQAVELMRVTALLPKDLLKSGDLK